MSFELSFQRSFDASFRRSFEASDERSDALSFETSDARCDVTSFEMSYERSYEVSFRVSFLRHFPANSETSFPTSFGERNRGVEDSRGRVAENGQRSADGNLRYLRIVLRDPSIGVGVTEGRDPSTNVGVTFRVHLCWPQRLLSDSASVAGDLRASILHSGFCILTSGLSDAFVSRWFYTGFGGLPGLYWPARSAMMCRGLCRNENPEEKP
jgi:hypothetical protein